MKNTFLKSAFFAASLLIAPLSANAADTYKFDPNHTNINWRVNHFGFSDVSGRFGIKEGTLILDEKNIQNSSALVIIDINGLATGIEKFDEHIKSSDFLDSKKYPTATFKSKQIKSLGGNNYEITGDLTLHGVTKPALLKAKLNKVAVHPMLQKKTVGFSATTTIKRSDFGVDKYAPNVADQVQINIEFEANIV